MITGNAIICNFIIFLRIERICAETLLHIRKRYRLTPNSLHQKIVVHKPIWQNYIARILLLVGLILFENISGVFQFGYKVPIDPQFVHLGFVV